MKRDRRAVAELAAVERAQVDEHRQRLGRVVRAAGGQQVGPEVVERPQADQQRVGEDVPADVREHDVAELLQRGRAGQPRRLQLRRRHGAERRREQQHRERRAPPGVEDDDRRHRVLEQPGRARGCRGSSPTCRRCCSATPPRGTRRPSWAGSTPSRTSVSTIALTVLGTERIVHAMRKPRTLWPTIADPKTKTRSATASCGTPGRSGPLGSCPTPTNCGSAAAAPVSRKSVIPS